MKDKINILIGTPICDKKMYSWKEYASAIKSLKPVKDTIANVLVVDNSDKKDKLKEEIWNKTGFYYDWIKEKKPMDKVVKARNKIFEHAIENNYAYVLFIDSDVIVPDNTLTHLFSNKEKETSIISGFYPLLNEFGFPTPCAKMIIDGKIIDFDEKLVKETIELGVLSDVDIIGLGCCLIPREIFTKIKFRCERRTDGRLTKSEDWCFCEDVKKNGYKILFDPELVAKHKIIGEHWNCDTA